MLLRIQLLSDGEERTRLQRSADCRPARPPPVAAGAAVGVLRLQLPVQEIEEL